MTLKSDAKLEEKLICCFKNGKNLANFDPSAKKSEMCISTKYIMFELQSTEELCFMTLKSDTKFEEKLTEEFGKFLQEHSKVSKVGLS